MTAWTFPGTSEALVNRVNSLLRRVPVWAVHAAGAAYVAALLYMGATGGLGVEPIRALEQELGKAALILVVAGLAVTPLRRRTGLNLIRFRRALGVLAFACVGLHLLVWLVLDLQSPALIWADIVKRPYVTVGMAGFGLLVPLGLTSNDLSVRRLGAAAWRRLHRLVYPAAILGAVHFVMLAKGWQTEPLAYLGAVLVLLALRLKPAAMFQRA